MLRCTLFALGAASAAAFSMPHAVSPPRTAARVGAAPTMKGPFDLTGKVAFVAGVADSTGCKTEALEPPAPPRGSV